MVMPMLRHLYPLTEPVSHAQAWGAPKEQFDQAPPSGAEWGRANNVLPPAQEACSSGQPARALVSCNPPFLACVMFCAVW